MINHEGVCGGEWKNEWMNEWVQQQVSSVNQKQNFSQSHQTFQILQNKNKKHSRSDLKLLGWKIVFNSLVILDFTTRLVGKICPTWFLTRPEKIN